MIGASIEVDVFSPEEAREFLQIRTGSEDLREADDLASELGFLPLALAQAAWLIRSQRLSFADYLQRLRTMPISDLTPRVPGESYPRGTAEAALLAVTDADTAEGTGLVGELADLISILSPAGVHRKVLYAALSQKHPTAAVDTALGALLDASLLTADLGGQILIMHRLVQRVLRDHAGHDGTLSSTIGRAISVLESLLKEVNDTTTTRGPLTGLVENINATWEAASRYGHIRDDAGAAGKTGLDLLGLRRSAVGLLIRDHELSRACALGNAVLEDHLGILGPDHLLTE